ncbi:hypothetical protein [Phytohabitans houttuyneae]|uniref:CHAT domain-containing protein n=1 Tax=Phytohabitans houttuyneae TaxID=1076126 RepID=A0A6V8KNF3_9ACTN|nr:hypothetical protein [Phytohabitans houttuyneae]GFJ84118.1 hypothetical protein Phou_082980 [Phytohabitans houttuyneae]
MLLTVCTDDDDLRNVAVAQAASQRPIFGYCYHSFEWRIPPLQADENLFITAHGAFNSDRVEPPQPIIGDHDAWLWLTGEDLFANLRDIIPTDYHGAVYISACESADGDAGTPSFAQSLLRTFREFGYDRIRVYGHRGEVGLLTPPPGDPDWVQAN